MPIGWIPIADRSILRLAYAHYVSLVSPSTLILSNVSLITVLLSAFPPLSEVDIAQYAVKDFLLTRQLVTVFLFIVFFTVWSQVYVLAADLVHI